MSTTESVGNFSAREIEAELNQLRTEFYGQASESKGPGNSNNTRSPGAVFSGDTVDCYLCTYCNTCENCVKCTHCTECRDLYDSRYCHKSKHSSGCSYVLVSTDCHDCVFCFACVGLVKKEFYILNQPYSRERYFELLPKLKRRFGIE